MNPTFDLLQHLNKSGTWMFRSDMYHIDVNLTDVVPHGFSVKYYEELFKSHQMDQELTNHTGAKVLLGHSCGKGEGLRI